MSDTKVPEPQGWGKERHPSPGGAAFIECDEMKCVGCGICQMACSIRHHGVINKELARIQVRKYLLPLPKAVQVTCVLCPEAERECEKACVLSPPAIHYDKDLRHMVVDKKTCLGNDCLVCVDACSARAIRAYPNASSTPFVCDLCDVENNGKREPQCVSVCPYSALSFVSAQEHRFDYSVQDARRRHADEKAELISRRLYPLKKDSMGYPGWK
jgi:Fe-S-cluster-containing dehydrogenase component